MGYTICVMCGKLFANDGNKTCPKCKKAYSVVRDYVRNNPGVSALDINSNTGVPINIILKLIDQGVLNYCD